LIRPILRIAGAGFAALVALSLPAYQAAAQQQIPAATAADPSAPAPTAAPMFPPPDPTSFTAATPTKDTVNAFLQASWGYDDSRVWQVQAIVKTHVEGISKVVVFVGDKTGKQKPSAIQFFALQDGKHIIAGDDMLTFGAHPFADARAELAQRANGPYRNAASKDLELVEFADFQCPHCKEAQANMDKLVVDFPKARIVFQIFPLASIHPESINAASYGVCVAKAGGSAAFFQFAAAVFDGQDGLNTPDGATLTLNSAVTKANLDPAKIGACATTPETKAEVDSMVKLATDLGINQVPTLMVNGRQVPANIPYDTLKQIVAYQAKLDGATQ
jgi:protein-disulfide isomerase